MRKIRIPKSSKKVILVETDPDTGHKSYVERVESTGWDTVKMYFVWTNDRKKAKVFEWDNVFPYQATTSIGGEFTKGFARGRIMEVKNANA